MISRTTVLLGAALLAGCLAVFALSLRSSGEARPTAAAPIHAATHAGSAKPLPAPTGPVVLRIAGVAHGNVGAKRTELDFKTIDRLAGEELALREPFLKRDVRISGLRMGDLLRRAGAPASAGSLYLHALDDYHVDLPMPELVATGILATRIDGKPIEIADGGPIRLVFTSAKGLGANTDNWIWSIDSMRARP